LNQPTNGSATHDGAVVSYTPAADFCGDDTFGYSTSDGDGATDTATVVVTVECPNTPPIADDEQAVTDEDVTLEVDVLAGDIDADGDALTVSSVTQGANGAVVNLGSSVSYAPSVDYCGTDYFEYTVSDGKGGTDVGLVTVTVTCVNDAPDAADDYDEVESGETVTIDVAFNDTDVDLNLDVSSVVVTTAPSSGSAIANGDGTVDYTADAEGSGSESFVYEICDAEGACDTATVTVLVSAPEAEAGVLEFVTVTAGGSATPVSFANAYADPVVVCSSGYTGNTSPIVVRVTGVTSVGFEVYVQNPSGGGISDETVSCMVVEAGAWTVDGVQLEAQKYASMVTDSDGSWVGESQSYLQSYTNPVVLGQVMTDNDADWSVFWSQGSSRTSPPSSSSLVTGKMVGEDGDVTRSTETVGFIVLESGHGVLGGVEYEAALGADSVQGVGDSPPYAYGFGTPFSNVPDGAVVTMSAVDGPNGGWAQLHGASALSVSQMQLSIDEDQIGDSERNHTAEQVAYVAFSLP
jgi:hypothetical protein